MVVDLTNEQLAQLRPVFKELKKTLDAEGPGATIAAQIYSDGMRVAFLDKELTDAFMVALGATGRLHHSAYMDYQ